MIDVTVAHVRGLAQAGYPNLPLDDLIRTRIHKVTPEFVRDLAAVGYKNIAVEDLIKMGIHGATPANIKALQDQGIRGLPVEELIKFRIHKVTPEFIKAMEARGWIERRPDPSHGRIIQIGLTEAGMELLQRCDAAVLNVENLMFPDLPEDERAWLHAQLRNAVRALSLHGI